MLIVLLDVSISNTSYNIVVSANPTVAKSKSVKKYYSNRFTVTFIYTDIFYFAGEYTTQFLRQGKNTLLHMFVKRKNYSYR